MTVGTIIRIVYFAAFSYLAAGLSTTDIVRLTAGQKRPVLTHDCYCENCGCMIPLSNQLPVISHLMNRGRCRNCDAKIPVLQFVQECGLFAGMLLIGVLFRFQPAAFLLSILYYELFKTGVLLYKGVRTEHFGKQLTNSLLMNLLIFGCGFLLYCLLWLLLP